MSILAIHIKNYPTVMSLVLMYIYPIIYISCEFTLNIVMNKSAVALWSLDQHHASWYLVIWAVGQG